MILADTNIFLEILSEQGGKEKCKRFLAATQDKDFNRVKSEISILFI